LERVSEEVQSDRRRKMRFFLGIVSDRHDESVENTERATDDVQMSVGDGVETPRIDGDSFAHLGSLLGPAA